MNTLISKLPTPEQSQAELVGHSLALFRKRGFDDPEPVENAPYHAIAWDARSKLRVCAAVVGRGQLFGKLVLLLRDEYVGRMLKYGRVRFEVHGWRHRQSSLASLAHEKVWCADTGKWQSRPTWWCDWVTLKPEDFHGSSEGVRKLIPCSRWSG
jgi:hypothetical protein